MSGSSDSSDRHNEYARGANVRFPPPLIFLSAIILGVVLNRFAPLNILSSTSVLRRLTGWGLVALCAGLIVSARMLFIRAKTTVLPFRPSTALVEGGPFRFTRNPMYLGMSCLVAGIALLANNFWIVAGLAIAVGIVNGAVIPREERYLESLFGDEYRQYKSRVRRWV
jgi:protein-S-isoprenylcysteine O-methyltransferase Ste14